MPNLMGGGAERVAVNLANAFAQRGYRVDMVLLSATGVFLQALSPDVRVVDLRVKRMRNFLNPLTDYLREAQPTAMLACMWPLTVVAPLAAKLARVSTRIVVAEHCIWSREEICKKWTTRWHVRLTMRLFFPMVDGIVAVSMGTADDLARFSFLPRKTISVIYNPIVGAQTSIVSDTLPPVSWWIGSHQRILAVGKLKVVKDYTCLLNAFALLVPRLNVKLLILGEGEERVKLEQLIRALDIEDKVCLHGFVSDPGPYYQQAELFVLSSTSEGFGNVLVEALAAGTPVVSTDCPSGPGEILEHGKFGLLAAVGDEQSLCDAMMQSLIADHDTDELKARAQDFSIATAVDKYEALLMPESRLRKTSR